MQEPGIGEEMEECLLSLGVQRRQRYSAPLHCLWSTVVLTPSEWVSCRKPDLGKKYLIGKAYVLSWEFTKGLVHRLGIVGLAVTAMGNNSKTGITGIIIFSVEQRDKKKQFCCKWQSSNHETKSKPNLQRGKNHPVH